MAQMKTSEQRRKQDQSMWDAIAAYTGPVTKCPPGKARSKPVPLHPVLWGQTVDFKVKSQCLATDVATQWLGKHANDRACPIEEQKVERRRIRMAQLQQRKERDDKRNAPEIRRANRHKRIAELRQRQMEQR
jgi:hypothetical protein